MNNDNLSNNLSKKELLDISREKQKLELNIGGIRKLNGKPDLVVIFDVLKDRIAVLEAKKLNIRRLSIETGAGNFFIPARKLFKRCDFKTCKPFAHYKDDVNSIYLTRQINNDK